MNSRPVQVSPHWLGALIIAGLMITSTAAWSAKLQAPWVGESLTGKACNGPSAGNFGPYDYRADKDKLPVVENRHFTARVEQLQAGETGAHPMGDVAYTLVKFPNHHRALYSAVVFSLSEKSSRLGQRYQAECFLQRANYFSPKDSVPYMLYGLYLHRLGKLSDSLEKYRVAERLAPTDANLMYNIGLALFDAGQYQESYQYAIKARQNGLGLPGLQRKLQKTGHWH